MLGGVASISAPLCQAECLQDKWLLQTPFPVALRSFPPSWNSLASDLLPQPECPGSPFLLPKGSWGWLHTSSSGWGSGEWGPLCQAMAWQKNSSLSERRGEKSSLFLGAGSGTHGHGLHLVSTLPRPTLTSTPSAPPSVPHLLTFAHIHLSLFVHHLWSFTYQ